MDSSGVSHSGVSHLEVENSDQVLNDIIDSAATVVEFDADDLVAQSLISDLATGMNKNPTIAQRYGLTMAQLYTFVSIPEVRKRIKTKRAIWESDDNLAERNKAYYGNVTLEAAPVLDKLIHNTATPPSHVLKAVEVAGRLGGVDVRPRASDEGVGGGSASAPFSVVIQFAASGRIETINLPSQPPMIEADAKEVSQ